MPQQNTTNTKFTNGLAAPNGADSPTDGLTAGMLFYKEGVGYQYYDGSDWQTFGTEGGSVDTMAPIGSSPNADGASISGNVLTLQPASDTYGGVLTAGAQSIAGAKTFTSGLTATTLTASSIAALGSAASTYVTQTGGLLQTRTASQVLSDIGAQPTGNYITSLTGEATGSGPGATAVTLSNSAVIGKVLSGLSVSGTTIVASDTILEAFGKTQNQINALVGGVSYQGTWNANTNSPTLTSSVGTKGYYYVVDVAGSTNLNGITDWKLGDWAIFNGAVWQKVDNTDAVISVNGQTGIVLLDPTNLNVGSGTANQLIRVNSGATAIEYFTITATDPIFYNPTTGVISSQAAGAAQAGYVTTGTQTFAGAKTFSGTVTASISAGSANNFVVSNSGLLEYRTAAQVLSDIGAAPLSGSTSYIQNQTASLQTADYKIQGSGIIDGTFKVTFMNVTDVFSVGSIGTGIVYTAGLYIGGNVVRFNSITGTPTDFSINGGQSSIALTATGTTSLTLPTSGTLATLAGSESLTNKKLGSLTSNGLVTTSGGDGTLSVTVPGTGVLAALAINVGSAGAFITNTAVATGYVSYTGGTSDLTLAHNIWANGGGTGSAGLYGDFLDVAGSYSGSALSATNSSSTGSGTYLQGGTTQATSSGTKYALSVNSYAGAAIAKFYSDAVVFSVPLTGTTATFSGDVSIVKASPLINTDRTATNEFNGLRLKTATTNNWGIGSGWNGVSTNFEVYNYGTSTLPLSINYSTNATTLTGALTGTSSTWSGKISSTATAEVFEALGASTTYKIFNIANTTGNLIFGVNNSAGNAVITTSAYASYIFTHSATDLVLGTNDLVRMTISSAGNVGIGTTNTSSVLEIGAAESLGTGSTNAIRIQSKTGASNQQLLFGVNQTGLYSYLQASQASVGNNILALNPNGGNVGIGTTSPTTYSGYTTLAINNATNGGIIDFLRNGTRVVSIAGDNTAGSLGTVTAIPFSIFTNNTTALTISSAQAATFAGTVTANQFITTMNAASTFAARVVNTNAGGAGLLIQATSNSSHTALQIYNYSTSLQLFAVFGDGSMNVTGAVTLQNLGTGTVQSTAGLLSVSSDSRMKDLHGQFKGSALEAITKIPKPEYWNFNANSKLPKDSWKIRQFSVLADRVYNVLGEEFAPTQKDGMHSLADRALLSLNIQATQEHVKETRATALTLEGALKRITQLEAEIKKLKLNN